MKSDEVIAHGSDYFSSLVQFLVQRSLCSAGFADSSLDPSQAMCWQRTPKRQDALSATPIFGNAMQRKWISFLIRHSHQFPNRSLSSSNKSWTQTCSRASEAKPPRRIQSTSAPSTGSVLVQKTAQRLCQPVSSFETHKRCTSNQHEVRRSPKAPSNKMQSSEKTHPRAS